MGEVQTPVRAQVQVRTEAEVVGGLPQEEEEEPEGQATEYNVD